MFLELNCARPPIKLVYQLKNELQANPNVLQEIHALTLNKEKPSSGLSGKFGLYGTAEWWNNLKNRSMPTEYVSGIIVRLCRSGQDSGELDDSIVLKLSNGQELLESIYHDVEEDFRLFVVGARVDIFYALDPLKYQPSPQTRVNAVREIVEMAVSTKPALVLPSESTGNIAAGID